MDPATGASTWAFGSQRWVIYIGIFTMNAIIVIIHQIFIIIIFIVQLLLNIIEEECFLFRINIRLIRRGREAVIVYIIKYMPACSRSGW